MNALEQAIWDHGFAYGKAAKMDGVDCGAPPDFDAEQKNFWRDGYAQGKRTDSSVGLS